MSTLEICGDKKTIKKLKKQIGGKSDDGMDLPFNCNKIIPQPKDDPEFDWYNWNIENWGTKWGAYEQPNHDEIEIFKPDPANSFKFITEAKDSPLRIIRYPFLTAWSTLDPVVEKLSEMFPDVMIKYAFLDEGDQFAGFTYFKEGKMVKEIDMTTKCNEMEKYITQPPLDNNLAEFEYIYQDMINNI